MNPTSAHLWYRVLRMLLFSVLMIVIVVFLLRSQRESQQRLRDSIASDQLYDSLKELLPNCNSVDCSGDTYSKSRRDQYCSKTMYPGAEGMHFHFHEHYELQNLVIMIRHGDRSSMHSLPNAKLIKFPTTSLLRPEVLQFLQYLSQFTLTFQQSDHNNNALPPTNASQPSKGEDLSRVFDVDSIFQETSDYLLPQGQLTSQGFYQHLQLGSILRQRYEEYFHKIHSPEQLYIRSTNYLRTIRSVSALLIGAMPQLFANKQNPIEINAYENEHNEIMHGIGIHHSSHNIPPQQSVVVNASAANKAKTSESVTLGGCAMANKYAKRQSDKFRRKIEVINQAIQLFGQEMVEYNPTEIVDAIVPIYCHGLPLPCSNKKPNQFTNSSTNSITSPSSTTKNTVTATSSSTATTTTTTPSGTAPKPAKSTANNNGVTTTTTTSLPPGEGKDTDSGEEDHTATGFLRSNNNARVESCIQLPYLEDIMMDADRMYCERFSGKDGGQIGTNLAYYPLLQEIYERLLGPHNEHKPHDHKLSVLSGHDTVIAPILSALGVYRSASLCYWPGYASRIVFELWKPISHSVHHIAKGEIIPYEEAIRIATNFLTKAPPTKLKMAFHTVNITHLIRQIEENRELFVRVIYNGKDITQLIPTCMHERIAIAKAIVDKNIQLVSKSLLSQLDNNFPLCSVVSFKQQVQELISPYQTVQDACRG